MSKLKSLIILLFAFVSFTACTQDSGQRKEAHLVTGADQTELYFTLLKGKKIGLVANHSSLIGITHLADTLLSSGLNIVKVFGPEHGFRGKADAGEHLVDGIDIKTGLPVVSLYGNNRKPTHDQLKDIDIILFDLQDVGVRFYTYISTLTYVMEAAAEQDITVMVLDRPNPNGFYIDGPVMEEEFTSFVGLHPVPIVYGMTIGEYGKMVNGEGWLDNGMECDLKVISIKNYDRNKIYELPVKPSPNLPRWQSIYLYPSLCLFEGTVVSVGRGTETPFMIYGHPDFHIGSYAFTPESKPGARHPKLEGKLCTGQSLMGYADNYYMFDEHLNLTWILGAYEYMQADSSFFNTYFEKLAGTAALKKQIMAGLSQEEIKATWQEDLEKFKKIRNKYLIYKDFNK